MDRTDGTHVAAPTHTTQIGQIQTTQPNQNKTIFPTKINTNLNNDEDTNLETDSKATYEQKDSTNMSEQENEHTTEEESIEEEEDTSTDDYESLEEKSTDSDEEALIHTFNSVPLDVEVLKAYGGITDNMNLSPRATQIKGDRTSRGNSGGGKHNNQSTMTRSQSKVINSS